MNKLLLTKKILWKRFKEKISLWEKFIRQKRVSSKKNYGKKDLLLKKILTKENKFTEENFPWKKINKKFSRLNIMLKDLQWEKFLIKKN